MENRHHSNSILPCFHFHSALKLVCELMLISADGYRETFYRKRPKRLAKANVN